MGMPTPLDKAFLRLAQLEREIAEVRRFIELYHEFDDGTPYRGRPTEPEAGPSQLSGNKLHTDSNQIVDKSGAKARRARSEGPPPKEIAALMERVIRERGEPMSRGQLVDAFERREVEIPATDKSRYLGTIAWRNKSTFVNIEGLGYWLRGEPFYRGAIPTPDDVQSDPPEEHSDELPE
jgi:hypothetical protein